MKERPILFSTAMVRVLLLGRKTQTRRAIKKWYGDNLTVGNRADADGYHVVKDHNVVQVPWTADTIMSLVGCPYGQVGDRLWVRESYRLFDSSRDCTCEHGCSCHLSNGKPYFKAESPDETLDGPWKPSIHMPRKFCRILLEITEVKAERVHDISEEDAWAEGVYGDNPRQGYKDLWNKINGKGAWESNPWVWVVKFKRVEVK